MNIQYNNEIKERFIPIEYNKLCTDTLVYLKSKNILEYRKFAEFLSGYYYENSYTDIQIFKNNYLPFSPDNELIIDKFNDVEYKNMESKLFEKIDDTLNDANYEVLTKEMLEEAIQETSPYGIEVSINFDDFDEVKIYFRGQSIQKDEVLDPMKLYLKTKIITAPIYNRLLLVIKPKKFNVRAKELASQENISIEKANKQLKNNEILIEDDEDNNIYIKLFKNIPQIDLEMLFPNTKIKMRLFDKLKIAVLGGGGTLSGGATLTAKLGSIAIDPLSALVALGAFGGVLWRQIKSVLYRKNQYMAQLAQKLYFYNLANNSSALIQCVENANDEQMKETLLVYLFLIHEENPISKAQLDKKIEDFIYTTYKIKINYEINDGLNKLKSMDLLNENNFKLSVNKI